MRVTLAGHDRQVHLAVPSGDGPWPGVVVLHEIWGLNDDLRRIADRFASLGYLAAAPDLYGAGLGCMIRTFRDLSRGHGPAVATARASVEWLAAHDACTGRVGVAGFCMGGGFALLLGTDPHVDAIAPCYGPVPKDADHLSRLCPTVASYGALDRPFRAHVARLRDALVRNAIAHDVVVYPNAGHSFMTRGAPTWARPFLPLVHATYVEDAAEDAWRRIDRFFDTHLRAPGATGA